MGIAYGSAQSYSLWIKLRAEIASGQYWFMNKVTTNPDAGYYTVAYEYNSGAPRLRYGNAATAIYTTLTMGTANWYHAVLTYGGGSLIFYLNGTAQGTTVSTSTGGVSAWNQGYNLGMYNVDGTASPASCLIDDDAVFAKTLSQTEVLTLYNEGASHILTPNSKFW